MEKQRSRPHTVARLQWQCKTPILQSSVQQIHDMPENQRFTVQTSGRFNLCKITVIAVKSMSTICCFSGIKKKRGQPLNKQEIVPDIEEELFQDWSFLKWHYCIWFYSCYSNHKDCNWGQMQQTSNVCRLLLEAVILNIVLWKALLYVGSESECPWTNILLSWEESQLAQHMLKGLYLMCADALHSSADFPCSFVKKKGKIWTPRKQRIHQPIYFHSQTMKSLLFVNYRGLGGL